jgi:hypothetical protein
VIHARRRGSMDAPEEVILDGTQLSEGHRFFAVQGMQVCEGQDVFAYAIDTVGRRIASIHFRDITTGETRPEVTRTPPATWRGLRTTVRSFIPGGIRRRFVRAGSTDTCSVPIRRRIGWSTRRRTRITRPR